MPAITHPPVLQFEGKNEKGKKKKKGKKPFIWKAICLRLAWVLNSNFLCIDIMLEIFISFVRSIHKIPTNCSEH